MKNFLRLLTLSAVATVANGCSYLRASPIPTTPFLTHGSELRAQDQRAPWDAVWSSDPGRIAIKSTEVRKIYVAPVNTEYLNSEKNEKGELLFPNKIEPADIQMIADLIRSSFIKEITDNSGANLTVVDSPGLAEMRLELALTELVPTKVGVNSVVDVGGLIVPGSKLIANTLAVGGQAAGGAYAAGSIAIEMKLVDGKSGKVIAEAKDREGDAMSILPNYRDFEEFGWSKHTIKQWAEQFTKMFSTPITEKVGRGSDVSIVMW